MPIPAGYTQLTTGFWRKDSDLSGPYAWTGAAFYLISTGVAGSGVAADYTQHPSGFWFKTADGSGPYSYDGTNFWLAGNGGPSGAITVATVNVTSAINMSNGSTFNLYNTADQTTNYERLRAYWSGNTALLSMEYGGSASSREIRIGSASAAGAVPVHYFRANAAASPALGLVGGNWGGGIFASVTGVYNADSVTQTAFAITPTINQFGTAGYIALDINPTESATGSGTKLLQRWAVGGTQQAYMTTTGGLVANILVSTNGLSMGASLGAVDLTLTRDAADTLALRRSTNAQTDRNYETYTDGSNYSRMYRSWLAGFAYFGTQAAGTGTRRPLIVQHFTTTVSALPAAATAGAGSRAVVSDATAPAFGVAVVGGGAVVSPVYSDGANWIVG